MLPVEQKLSSTSGSSLASAEEHRLPHSPAPDQARHRDGPPGNSALAGENRRGLTAVISVQPLGQRLGRLRLAYSNGAERIERFRARRAESSAEVVLAGYWAALVWSSGTSTALYSRFVTRRSPAICDGRYAARNPDILRRWELLLAAVDGLNGIRVSSETDGSCVVWSGDDRLTMSRTRSSRTSHVGR